MFYIYQFSNESGSKEVVIISDDSYDEKELEEITPSGTAPEQVVICDAISGDPDALPLDRILIHPDFADRF